MSRVTYLQPVEYGTLENVKVKYSEYFESYYDDEEEECPDCRGTGLDRDEYEDCPTCWGEGVIVVVLPLDLSKSVSPS